MIDCSVAAVTVNVIELETTPLCVAVMLLDPIPAPLARPLVPIVTAAVFDDAHEAEFVRF